ncbi:hypothetical protein GA0070624_2640 [Micromonospora rhizosphaerae]|uniref:Uncharacterized protein n=1 Tax=Micromonospora rhizosphaerae TaxID=568872 RepID=A0A1C6S0Y5_9ACTN|nr:hypothetical protein GA0070624_2640 [Micromonospora rhizosphaerae]
MRVVIPKNNVGFVVSVCIPVADLLVTDGAFGCLRGTKGQVDI